MDQTQGNRVLNAILTQTTGVNSTTGMKVRLGSNSPTNISNMTELTGGTGYTTGGQACTFNAASSESTSNSTTLSWTNGSGGNWTINGIEIWDQAGTPLRWLQGTWIGAPITVANGNAFAVASGGIAVTIA